MDKDFDLKTRKTVIFVSGGGSGFGRACALTAATMFENDSLLLICGRNLANLNETAAMVKEQSKTMKVEVFQMDMEKVNYKETKAILNRVWPLKSSTLYDCFVIIHNSGSSTDPRIWSYELVDRAVIEASLNANITGPIIVNNALLDHIRSFISNNKVGQSPHLPLIMVVNVSSTCAKQACSSVSVYCTTKAAREMYFRCLSTEWSLTKDGSSPSSTAHLFVLNYAPGVMKTAILMDAIRVAPVCPFFEFIRSMEKADTMNTPDIPAKKLFLQILANYSSFESPAWLNYYDELHL